MKTVRGFTILYLVFVLWLLLFPPWIASSRATYFYPDSALKGRLGHHWRFSDPEVWGWSVATRQSFLTTDPSAKIDYRLMLYEAAIGLIASLLAMLLWQAAEGVIQQVMVYAKVERMLLRNRLRNLRSHREALK